MKVLDKIEDLKNRLRRTCQSDSISRSKRLEHPVKTTRYPQGKSSISPAKKLDSPCENFDQLLEDHKIARLRIRLVVIETTRLSNRRLDEPARHIFIDSLRRLTKPARSITVSSMRTLDKSQSNGAKRLRRLPSGRFTVLTKPTHHPI